MSTHLDNDDSDRINARAVWGVVQPILYAIAIGGLIAGLLVYVTGCKSHESYRNDADAATALIDRNLVSGGAAVEAAGGLVNQAKPHSTPTGKALLDAAGNLLGRGLGFIRDSEAEVVAVKAAHEGMTREYNALAGDAWVRAALWLKRLVYTLVIVTSLLYVAGIAFGGFGAGGLLGRIGRSILNFLPFSGPGVMAAKVISAKRGTRK